ncbi:MAG TPA: serine/threonine-protein kinase [Longimicrobiales bacterium]
MREVDSETVLAGRYMLQREIGRGGMGAVFLARDLKHDSRVAVKMLGPGFGSADAVDRFLAEIRTAAKLNHAHILTIHDSGEADGELYYVMPHIEGASLRERLDRESRLSITDALRIGCQVARALGYAHAHGVIHRDVKPENLLLDPRGHPYLMDFGLARALSSVTAGRRTARGMTVGSPPYMSPEQAAGEDVDGRSDIYSLGCVLFEMLVGEPPFTASNAQALLRMHLTEPPPSLRSRRADIPEALDRVVRTALAKEPDQRQSTADQLARDLEAVLDATARRPKMEPQPHAWRRRVAIGAGVLLVAAALLWASGAEPTRRLFGEPPDSTRWLVLPLEWAEGSLPPMGRNHDQLLYAAFDRWADLDLVPRQQVNEAVADMDRVTMRAGFRLSRDFDAGRFVQGLASHVGDSIQVDLTVSSVDAERPLSRLSLRLPADGAVEEQYAIAADSLLFGRVSWSDGPESDIGTRSASARRAYGAAHGALRDWQIERADSLFRAALERDPGFARAHFWLAQLTQWRGRPTESWLATARAAHAGGDALDTRERRLAFALVALGEGRHDDAAAAYADVRRTRPADFAAWYGTAECSMSDERVVRDRRSPSGWRFRASYRATVQAYRTAFELEPGSFRLVRDDAFARLRDEILMTRRTDRRKGSAADGREFSARPQLIDDTLALVPYPFIAGGADPDIPGTDEALERLQQIFRSVARGWSTAYATDADALHAVALALEMTGDGAALDTVIRARTLVTAANDGLEIALREVWLRVKLSAVRETMLPLARSLADSILSSSAALADLSPVRVGALAALVGRPTLGARHVRRDPPSGDGFYPTSVTRPAAALLVFAAVGGPEDSIAALEAATSSAIRHALIEEERPGAQQSLLQQPAMLSFPSPAFDRMRSAGVFRAPLSQAQTALLRADTARALQLLTPHREGYPSTLDMSYTAASIAVAAGDTATAVVILDHALSGIRWIQPGMIERAPHAGSLVRSMALRAELGHARGDDAEARGLARAVLALWGAGEPAVGAVIGRMRALAE